MRSVAYTGVLNRGNSALPGYLPMSKDIFGCQNGEGGRDAAEDPTELRTALQQGVIPPRMSIVPKLKNSGLHHLKGLLTSNKIHMVDGTPNIGLVWNQESNGHTLHFSKGLRVNVEPLYLQILPSFLAFVSICLTYSEVDQCYSKGGLACGKVGRCIKVASRQICRPHGGCSGCARHTMSPTPIHTC